MEKSIRIFSYLPNPRVWKATIAGRLCGVDVEVRGAPSAVIKTWLWDFDARPLSEVSEEELQGLGRQSRRGFKNTVLFKTDRFLDANPYGTVPAAFSGDGKFGVFESNSIMRLVARLGAARFNLLGNDPFEASRIDSFLDAGLSFGHDVQRYLLALYSGTIDPSIHGFAQRALENYLSGIEHVLTSNGDAIVGKGITLADICFACEIALLATEQRSTNVLRSSNLPEILTGAAWGSYPRAFSHFDKLAAHPSFAEDISSFSTYFDQMRQSI